MFGQAGTCRVLFWCFSPALQRLDFKASMGFNL